MATTGRRRTGGVPRPEETLLPDAFDVYQSLQPGERLWVLTVPTPARTRAAAHGAHYHPGLRTTIYTGTDLPYELTPYAAEDYTWERWLEDDMNHQVLPPAPPRTTQRNRRHQEVAAVAVAAAAETGSRGFFIADAAGLGKTHTAVAAVRRVAYQRPLANVLVVAPLSALPQWRRTIAAAGDGGLRWCVVNYDRLRHLLDLPDSAAAAETLAERNTAIVTDGEPLVRWDAVIFDDAHRIGKPGTLRHAAAMKIGGLHRPPARAPFVLWLSGTDLGEPADADFMWPLLRDREPLLPETPSGEGWRSLGFAYGQTARGAWRWTGERDRQVVDRERLGDLIFGGDTPYGIRRGVRDVPGQPSLTRALTPIDLDAAARDNYHMEWTRFTQSVTRNRNRTHSPTTTTATILRFRQKASLLRVPATVQHVVDHLADGCQVVVSCEFTATVDALLTALLQRGIVAVPITGRRGEDREDNRAAFQRGGAAVVVTTATEGVDLRAGETLNGARGSDAERVTLVHDVRYSRLDLLGIEGRTRRPGTPTTVHYLYAVGTVEEDIARLAVRRLTNPENQHGEPDFASVIIDAAAL